MISKPYNYENMAQTDMNFAIFSSTELKNMTVFKSKIERMT